jgi:hypothetical protein
VLELWAVVAASFGPAVNCQQNTHWHVPQTLGFSPPTHSNMLHGYDTQSGAKNLEVTLRSWCGTCLWMLHHPHHHDNLPMKMCVGKLVPWFHHPNHTYTKPLKIFNHVKWLES